MKSHSSSSRIRSRIGVSGTALAGRLVPRLRPVPTARVKVRLRELAEAARAADAGETLAPVLGGRPQLGPFIASVLDCSPFLRSLILADVPRLIALLSSDPGDRLAEIVASTARSWKGTDEASLMAALRQARQETALLVALADLGGVWDIETVTAALSD